MSSKKRYRTFVLKGGIKPLSYFLATKNTKRNSLFAIVDNGDGGKISKALRYSRIHSTPYLDEQQGDPVEDPIVFIDGYLVVDSLMESSLLNFLEATPDNGRIFEELNKEKEASEEVEEILLENKAINVAKSADEKTIRAILFETQGLNTDDYTLKELRRDALIYARRDPEHFLSYFNNPDVKRMTMVLSALENKLLSLRNNEQDWHYNFTENKKRFLQVPFEEDAKECLANYFEETVEGRQLYVDLEKMLEEM